MAKRKLLTLHTPFNLTTEVVSVLYAVAENIGATETKTTADGLVVLVDQWSRHKP